MDWVTGIQNAINYIENHLTDEIDMEAYTEGNMGGPDYRSEIWVPVVKK